MNVPAFFIASAALLVWPVAAFSDTAAELDATVSDALQAFASVTSTSLPDSREIAQSVRYPG